MRAACRRHGFAATSLAPMTNTGMANWVYALDGDYVLRVSRPLQMAEEDVRTEVVAVPVAVAAGIRTPQLLVFDDSRTEVQTPFTIYQRVPGTPEGATTLPAAARAAVHRELGREMAAIHHRITSCDDTRGWLHHPVTQGACADHLETALRADVLSPDEARWAVALLKRLMPAIEAAGATPFRFLHGDLLPMNVMVHDAAFASVIDWGGAGWGDPALEFYGLHPELTDDVVAGYREVASLDDVVVERARAEQLGRALRHFVEPHRRPTAEVLLAALRRALP